MLYWEWRGYLCLNSEGRKEKKSEKNPLSVKKSVQSKIWICQENKINVFLLSKYWQNSGDIYLAWCKYNPD